MTEHEKNIERLTKAFAEAADERDSLKARLEAVVKECEKINEEKFRMNEVLAAKGILNRILRAARGEGGEDTRHRGG